MFNHLYLIFDMKPRTRIQKEVVRLSSGLPELTDKQKAYAFEHGVSPTFTTNVTLR